MFRQKRNKSGSVSIQSLVKSRGCYKIVESIGSGNSEQEISTLMLKVRSVMKLLEGNFELFTDEEKSNYEHIISSIGNNQIQVIDPELIYGRLSDNIGYNRITNRLFSHLVITRLYI